MNNTTKQYYRYIDKHFPTHTTLEKRYLNQFKEFLEYYEINHPDYSLEDYIEHIGDHEEVIDSYYSRCDHHIVTSYMKKATTIKKYILVFGIIFSILVACFVYFCFQVYNDYQESSIDHFEETIEILEE